MDFDFSPEQKLFKDQVRRALEAACPRAELRAGLEGSSPYSDATWRALRQLGVTAAAIPEAYGGLGLGYYELCLAAEEAGRVLAPTPLSSSIYLTAEALLVAGNEAQKRRWLPQLASGEAVGAFVDSPAGRSAPRFADGRITGAFAPAVDASRADVAVVALGAPDPPDAILLLVDLAQPGVARRNLDSIDPTRDLTELRFDNVPAERLGSSGDLGVAERVKARAAVLMAFEQLGGADRALEMARDYALERRAFGRPIASYQAIKHKLANVYIRNEIARAHAYYGAWALSTDAADLPLAAAAARVTASEAFTFAAQENIQTHGGVGFSWDMDCHLFYRRARFLALQLGNVLDWKTRVIDQLEHTNG